MNKKIAVILVLFVVFFSFSQMMKPSEFLYIKNDKVKLAEMFPAELPTWKKIENLLAPIKTDSEQNALNEIYSDLYETSYQNDQGKFLMLSIAYGADQSNDTTQVHRPEYCYPAQGFEISHLEDSFITLDQKELKVRRLLGKGSNRTEYITYWIILGEKSILPGWERKITQFEYGMQGLIPDGLLFRISSVGQMSSNEHFKLHNDFIQKMYKHSNSENRVTLFGSTPNKTKLTNQ